MRETKFRGITKEGKWLIGDLVHGGLNAFSYTVDYAIHMAGYYPIEVIPETIGEFTGLLDKNGKEIYEGDVIKAWHYEYEEFNIAPVSFENGTFTIGRYWKDGCHDWHSMEQYEGYDIEIIGDIHTTPELLK